MSSLNAHQPNRLRLFSAAILLLVIITGLISRSAWALHWPEFLRAYSGDSLWAMAVFFGFALLLKRASTLKLVLFSAVFALSIELSQLYHAPWIDQIRAWRPAALILGHGFLWSDLLCYAVGIAAAAGLDQPLIALSRLRITATTSMPAVQNVQAAPDA